MLCAQSKLCAAELQSLAIIYNEKLKVNMSGANTHKFPLRVIPWFTDGCSTMLANLFKWLPTYCGRRLTVLEFGGGNSTFFFLSKGVRVVSVESDKKYIEFLSNISLITGYSIKVYDNSWEYSASDSHTDLSIVFAQNLTDAPELIGSIRADIIVNDGISRREVLEKIIQVKPQSIIVLDNVEYSANWGRLDRSSAKPDLIKLYRSFLRSNCWKNYIFEQSEGRDGRGSTDKTGWESPHRWMSAVCWPAEFFLNDLMITHLGFPVVNQLGQVDEDIKSLDERCPLDLSTMQWRREPFPEELDLKLHRNFD
jgi:hypothetical protein